MDRAFREGDQDSDAVGPDEHRTKRMDDPALMSKKQSNAYERRGMRDWPRRNRTGCAAR